MAGHDWKRVSFRGDLQPFVKVMLKHDSDTSKIRGWHCPKCGSVVVAEGGMKLRDARRRARIPFDCHLQIVKSVHDY
jgi:hypothetical protein